MEGLLRARREGCLGLVVGFVLGNAAAGLDWNEETKVGEMGETALTSNGLYSDEFAFDAVLLTRR